MELKCATCAVHVVVWKPVRIPAVDPLAVNTSPAPSCALAVDLSELIRMELKRRVLERLQDGNTHDSPHLLCIAIAESEAFSTVG